MGYDRYDERGGGRDERSRGSGDRDDTWRRENDWRRDNDWRRENDWQRDERSRHSADWRNDERGARGGGGFLERAGDQIASWFGGDDEDRGRRHRDEGRGHERDWRPERGSGRGDEGWFGSRGGSDRDRERERGGDYRPMAGDYGRSGNHREQLRGGGMTSGWDRDDDRERRDGRRDRDEYRDPRFAGSRAEHRDRDAGYRDREYHEHRQRHLDEFDRDYRDFHRERQSDFEGNFGKWREQRQSKRQLLGQVREHMTVVGSDGGPVGTVDRVAGDRIILTRSDPEAGGAHHSISCTDLDRIEGDRLILDAPADRARRSWRDEDRGRALFEREDQGEVGPHMLDRSFSGTYR